MEKKIPLLAMERALNRSVSVPERTRLMPGTGNIGGSASRIARGPDGSRGFETERAVAENAIVKLDPSAPPFVPKSLRTDSTRNSTSSAAAPITSSFLTKAKSVAL